MSHTAQILLIVLILVLVSISVCFVASAKTEQMEYPFKDWVFTENISSSGTALGQDNYRWNTVFGTAAAEGLDNGDLRYWVYLPKDYDPNKEYPLVVYLHGSTTSYKQNKGLTPWTSTINNKSLKLEKELRVAMGDCIIFAPQIPGDAVGHAVGHAWSNMESKMWSRMTVDNTGSSIYLKAVEKKMADFITDGVTRNENRYSVDMKKVYLIGDSMGAIGAYAMLVDCPTTFAGVIVRAGMGDPEKVNLWKDTPIRIFHGEADKNVPYGSSTKMIEALEAAGAKDAVRITVENGPHDIRTTAFQTFDPQGKNVYISWLAEQVRTDAKLPSDQNAPDETTPTDTHTTPDTNDTATKKDDSAPMTLAIVGIAVAVVAVISVVIAVILKKKSKS